MSSSLNISDLMDSSVKNFWIIAHYPHSDPGSEFEIIAKSDLEMEACDVIEKEALVTVKFGNARLQGTVVTVSDDYSYLLDNFSNIVDEYSQENRKHKSRNCVPHRVSHSSYRQIIKITDKETQTETEDVSKSDDYKLLKQQYEELFTKYEKLQSSVSKIAEGVHGVVSILEETKDSQTTDNCRKVLQELRDDDENLSKENLDKMVQIGSGGTKIPNHVFNTVKWQSYTAATRKLLITLFPRNILATHSLTGKPSPAFMSTNKQKKMRLDPVIISDIIEVISRKSHVSESLVRNAITTKCADENKMFKKRMLSGKKEDGDEEGSEMAKRIKMI